MSEARPAFAAALALEMRAPLARIELIASQLGREGGTPRSRELAETIGEAVGEIDRLIDRSVEIAAPGARSEDVDLRLVLDALRERIAPVLAARGVSWEPSPESRPAAGDGEAVRQATIHLLREVLQLRHPPVSLELRLLDEPSRYGVALAYEPDARSAAPSGPSDALRAFAAARGAAIESKQGTRSRSIRFWLPRRSVSCGAS